MTVILGDVITVRAQRQLLSASRGNSNNASLFSESNFPQKKDTSASKGRLLLILMNRSNYAAYLRHIFVSGLFDPTTFKVTVRHITVRHLRHVMNIPTMFQVDATAH